MDTNKSFIILIAFTIIFIALTFFYKPKIINKSDINTTETTSDQKTQITENNNKNDNNNNFEFIPFSSQETSADLIYENSNIKVEFDAHDAIIKHLWVKDTFLNRTPVHYYDIIQPNMSDDGALRLKFGSWDKDITLNSLTGGNNFYHFERKDDSFIFSYKLKDIKNNTIYTIIKTYEFIKNENVFKLNINITNDKNIPINFDNSDISFSIGLGPSLDNSAKINRQNKKITFCYLKSDKVKDINEKSPIFKQDNKWVLFKQEVKKADETWLANKGQYFALILLPDDQNYIYFFDYRDKANNNYYAGFSRSTNKSQLNSSFYLYAGPKINNILKTSDQILKERFNINNANFIKVEDEILFKLGNYLGNFLQFIYNLVHNYGIAIIILTIIIKVILFPLTYKSMVSQQKMSLLQPKLKEIQDKYKDKPEMLNKETMNLYKREGINPLGGCLPMLLQMPLLIAMYELLNNMVQLKGADFLWVKDLSMPDAVINFSFTIPFVNISSLNILPILMVAIQILSSLLMPNSQSNKQAQMMLWALPLVFFFLLYNVSSGLVLYWTVMNILNLLQQLYMNYKQKVK